MRDRKGTEVPASKTQRHLIRCRRIDPPRRTPPTGREFSGNSENRALPMTRSDGRRPDELRPVTIEPGFLKYAEGSALISVGNTRVLCAATLEERVPPWMKGRGTGWVTAEYAMLPRATQDRTQRESAKGRVGGRTHEIQRIIGRALRAVTDMAKLGERTIWIDCDVIQADGGTRTAAVTGAYVALALALRKGFDPSDGKKWPLNAAIAATSVGIVHGLPLMDLAYDEDSTAHVDMNVFMTDAGRFVEIQGTAEAQPFDRKELDTMLALAEKGIRELFELQNAALAGEPQHAG
ncbi:MAG TPA: ribonuclease PH [Candidatus Acidoferrales bacterium]|nr:ribonuclease PH [Candidatus Acidoferrales bacterium]